MFFSPFDFIENVLQQSNLFNTSGNNGNTTNGNNQKQPPASKKAIDALPIVRITADDLVEQTNRECVVCLDEQSIGTFACKLPCGHIFHKPCVTGWLEKHCSCPVCRYELETEDPSYERARKKNMESRKLRMRKDELSKKSISQLRELCGSLQINIQGCIDKREIIERIADSNKVTLTENSPPLEIPREEFYTKSVTELKHLLLSYGLSTDGALEKSELRVRLLESGRVKLVENYMEGKEEADFRSSGKESSSKSESKLESKASASSSSSKSSDSYKADTPNNNSTTAEDFKSLSLGELRRIALAHNINLTGCLDKSDVIEKLINAKVTLPNPNNSEDQSILELSRELLYELEVSELKYILQSYGFDASSYPDRSAIISALEKCPRVLIVG